MNWFGLFKKSPLPASGAAATDAAVADASSARLPLPPPDQTPAPAPPPPEEIRRLLFDAVASGDEPKLESLCQQHLEFILRHGPGWLDVPAEFRSSPQLYEWYGSGLRAIARFCAERLRPPAAAADSPNLQPAPHSTRPTRH